MDPVRLYCWEHQSQEEDEVYTAGSTLGAPIPIWWDLEALHQTPSLKLGSAHTWMPSK